MEIDVSDAEPAVVEADVLAFPVTKPAALGPAARDVDRALGEPVARLIADREVSGARGELAVVHAPRRVAAAGVGELEDADGFRTAAAKAAAKAAALAGGTLAWIVEESGPLSPAEQGRAVVEGAALGPYDTGRWKTAPDRPRPALSRLVLCGPGAPAARDEALRAGVVASWANRCREIVDAPASEVTPTSLASWAQAIAAESTGVSVDVLDEEAILAAGMNAFAAVARGSAEPLRLVVLAYDPPTATRDDLVLGLVGKAITFDSGGYSIKPAARLSDMKTDMGGGAAVLAAIGAVAELSVPVRAIGVVAACENMIAGDAYRPGDILRAANGKTIEVKNTDAEGRLVLADALWHARERGATHLVDIATLTGGIVIALGDYYAGLFSNDDAWGAEILAAARASGDHAWPMPLHPTYERYLESDYADLTNSSDLRQATPVYAAQFLKAFAGEGPWAHLDIAGVGQLERGRGDYYAGEGASGYGVRLFAELARRLAG
jgi:leucyl aminopeptidase